MAAGPIVTLTTDFGVSDAFAGTMTGIVYSINPTARVVDITHYIPTQDVRTGAFIFDSAYHYFPPGTVHVLVVDPAVGTNRRAIVVESPDAYFVCPDNGILSYAYMRGGGPLPDAAPFETARVGLRDGRRPIGAFLLLGPTGVGKTELTKALAEFLFGSEEALIQLDMSEFMERHSVARLVGAPPGYVGYEDAGQLTEAVRRRPYSIVVFDEVEKAHPEAFNMLLQIMEEGTLTDARGRRIDFRNAMIVMTSNVGAKLIKPNSALGFNLPFDADKRDDEAYADMSRNITDELQRMFRPEFLNRVDASIIFRSLTRGEIKAIVDLELNKVRERLLEHAITLEAADAGIEWLAANGYDPEFGARPLRRLIQNEVEDRLSDGILSGEFGLASIVRVDADDDGGLLLLSVEDDEVIADELVAEV